MNGAFDDTATGTSWLLGGGYPWHSAQNVGVVADAKGGLALRALPDGALGLGAADGSLGGLSLPRGVAVDGDALFVLAQDGARIYRYDPLGQRLTPLPWVGMEGWNGDATDDACRAPRRFCGAGAIAAAGGLLYVADARARRVQVFDHTRLALVCIHDGLGTALDLAAAPDGSAMFILDAARGRVLRIDLDPLYGALPRVVVDAVAAQGADRIAVDGAGRIYLRRRRQGAWVLDVYEPALSAADRPQQHVVDSAQVRERFPVPVVTMDGATIVAPGRLLDPCGVRRPAPEGTRRWRVGAACYATAADTRTLDVLLADGRLRHRWGPLDADGEPTAPDARDAWTIVDVVGRGGSAWILDERHQRVFTHRPGDAALRLRFAAPGDAPRRWRRLAVDPEDCLLLWDGSSEVAERLGADGKLDGSARGQVPIRAVRRFFDRVPVAAPEWPAVRLTRAGALAVPAVPAHPVPAWPPARYLQHGRWTSGWFDSSRHDCQWHVLELALARLPSGSALRLRTRTTNDVATTRVRGFGLPGAWDELAPIVAPLQPPPGATTALDTVLLVQSPPGRYLQLQVDLSGAGDDTPLIKQVRLRFPRESLLDYLPALYSSVLEQRNFLERLLAVVDGTWSRIEREADSFERYLDPDSVPDEALGWLAAWLDLELEGTWSPAQNRRLLQAMVRLRQRWGTVDGLRGWVRVYLANMAGVDEAVLADLDVPGIVEGFVDRRHLLLDDAGATLGTGQPLWGAGVERRFQVGVFDRLGEIEVVSTGDPQTDVLRRGAHTFRVYVPAPLLRSAADEAKLNRAIEAQKPAHASYELVLVEPRLAIGVQSTIGLDSVVAGPGCGTLACRPWNDPPSLPPRGRLGIDTVLAGAHGRPAAPASWLDGDMR